MKQFLLTGLLVAGLAGAQDIPKGAFDIPFEGANKQSAMRAMKAAGFVLEGQDNHPKCGIDLYYGGVLMGEKAKAKLVFNNEGQWVGTTVTIRPKSPIELINVYGPLLVKYGAFEHKVQVNERYGEIHSFWYNVPDTMRGYGVDVLRDDENPNWYIVDYSNHLRQWESECRHYSNGL